MFIRLFSLAPACLALSLAQDVQPPNLAPVKPDPAVPVAKPTVTRLDGTRYQVGQVIFDSKSKEIRIPAKMGITTGLVEYGLVYERGNIHEALAITNINPTDLNLAFKFLRYKQSLELFSPLDDTGHPTGIYPDVPATTKVAARLGIHIEWTENGTTKNVPLSDCFESDGNKKRMPPGPWLHTERDFGGNVIAVRLDRYAMINDLGPANDVNGGWHVTPDKLPATGTNLTIIFSPCTREMILQETNTPTDPK